MRDAVVKFAKEMEMVLEINDDKGGWNDCEFSYLLSRLHTNVYEVNNKFDFKFIDVKSDIILEQQKSLIDIANYAMMIHEKLEDMK